jgi:hypothetical protein
LSETESDQVVVEMFEPQSRRHGQAVQTLDKAKTRFLTSSGLESAGKVNPDRLLELGLNKGRRKINGTCDPAERQGKDKHEPYSWPSDEGTVGLEDSFLKIASNTIAGFEFLDLAIRRALATIGPSARKDLVFGFCSWDFNPRSHALEGANLGFCGSAPLVRVFISHGLIVSECIRIRGGGGIDAWSHNIVRGVQGSKVRGQRRLRCS